MKQIMACVGLLLMLCGCFSEPTLQGKNFELQNAGAAKITLGFAKDEPRFYGAVVNRYFGNYKIEGNKIEFSPVGSTMMMGPEVEMKAEQEWLQMLPEVVEYKLDGNILMLKTKTSKEFKLKETKAEE